MKFISNTIRFFFLLISFFALYVIGAILYGMATEHHFPDQLKLSEELELVQAISDTTAPLNCPCQLRPVPHPALK